MLRGVATRHTFGWRATEGDQRGREPVVPEGHFRTEADRRTRSALSVSACAVPEQLSSSRITEPSNAGSGQPGIPGVSFGMANASRNRDDEHDPQGTSEVVGDGRLCWSGCIHRTPLWADERLIVGPAAARSRCLIQPLQHFRCPCRLPLRSEYPPAGLDAESFLHTCSMYLSLEACTVAGSSSSTSTIQPLAAGSNHA